MNMSISPTLAAGRANLVATATRAASNTGGRKSASLLPSELARLGAARTLKARNQGWLDNAKNMIIDNTTRALNAVEQMQELVTQMQGVITDAQGTAYSDADKAGILTPIFVSLRAQMDEIVANTTNSNGAAILSNTAIPGTTFGADAANVLAGVTYNLPSTEANMGDFDADTVNDTTAANTAAPKLVTAATRLAAVVGELRSLQTGLEYVEANLNEDKADVTERIEDIVSPRLQEIAKVLSSVQRSLMAADAAAVLESKVNSASAAAASNMMSGG